mmetsp:Transcript_125202/g.227777  ORF Transcript_125202/g.227777 Transcript_125202/m.227777 type:complete len:163 (+) Transcript_125202:3-491(+)
MTIQYEVPSRGMVGVKSRILTATKGLAVMTSTFAGYKKYAGQFGERDHGNLISQAKGGATSFSLMKAQERGTLFIKANDPVYERMIIGMNSKRSHMAMNVCKDKKQTNVRSAGKDENVNLTPPKQLTLEDAVEYVRDGEFVEVTPDAIRMGMREEAVKLQKS